MQAVITGYYFFQRIDISDAGNQISNENYKFFQAQHADEAFAGFSLRKV